MAAFSTSLGSSNALVGLRGKNLSLDLHTISLGVVKMPASSTWKKRTTRAKAVEAVATASRESMIDPAASLGLRPLCRDQSATAAVATASRESLIDPAASLSHYPLCRDQSAIAAAAAEVLDYRRMEEEEERRSKEEYVTAEEMDRWIKESIGEIVRNIGEAPFLVQIFSQGPSVLRLEREEALPESWPLVRKKWNQSGCVPEGIVLVEELKDEEEEEHAADDDSESQTWGLVVQGRGMECAAPCYILNTCRVRSAAGFCTHFCLVRAKCFGETLDKQLSKAWLQGR